MGRVRGHVDAVDRQKSLQVGLGNFFWLNVFQIQLLENVRADGLQLKQIGFLYLVCLLSCPQILHRNRKECTSVCETFWLISFV